jgi:ligand-binding sensor domain-containing protein
MQFERLTTSDGLSYNKVQCILQDRQGYLWFGTVYGLNRYDGYTFKVFQPTPGDSTSIAYNNIVSLFQDRDGLIWIGTSLQFFSCFDPRNEIFKNYSLPAGKKTYTIFWKMKRDCCGLEQAMDYFPSISEPTV